VSEIDHEVPVSSAHLTHILSSLSLFEGVPADVQKNEAVVAAYLGGELM